MTRPAAEFFDAYAHDFAAIYGNDNRAFARLINLFFRRSMRERYRRTLEVCRPLEGQTVLDVGCGPGHYAVAFAQLGAAHVVGIDFAPAMIALAQQRADAAGVTDRCTFVETDFMSYDESSSFDYTVFMGFMDYAADSDRVIERASQLTRDTAVFSFPASAGVLAWQRRLRYRHKTPLYMYSRADVETLTNAYFSAVLIDRIGRDYYVTARRQSTPV